MRGLAGVAGDGGPLTAIAIADPTTPFVEFETDIDINNQGTVAFTARLWNGSYGIYAGGDPVNDKVVEIGDFLFGQRVSSLGRPHLNNRGDIEFWFEVLDPRDPSGYWTGIALAVKQALFPGDYNQNGTVDAADYVLWRKSDGAPAAYNTWRANFGQSIGNGVGATGLASASAEPLSAAVPEPTSVTLVAFGLLLLRLRLRCSRAFTPPRSAPAPAARS